jgi:hypothetical protein
MKEHGWKWHGFLDWDETNNRYLIADFLMQTESSILLELNDYFLHIGQSTFDVPVVDSIQNIGLPFKLFLSHKSEHKGIAVQMKFQLGLEGIDAFVAHQDIQDSVLWRDSLKKELNESQGFAILLTEGIESSVWCQQEIGWAMSKQIPTIAVNFIPNPPNFGFLSDYQYIHYGANDLKDIAERIANSLLLNPVSRNAIRVKKFQLLRESWSFDRTRSIWKTIEGFGQLTDQEIEIVKDAFANNPQVTECSIDRKDPGVVIGGFIERQIKGLVR